MTKRCCGTSVGVLITDERDRLLMVRRGWWPRGTAPVAGHVHDAHATAAEAAVAEVREEVGLAVTGEPELLWEGHLPNLCASLPATRPGHHWWLYRAQATGTLQPAAGETSGAGWYSRDQVQSLADTTTALADGGMAADHQPTESLEAVWVEHLARLGWITVSERARQQIRRLYTTPPPQHWLGGRPTT